MNLIPPISTSPVAPLPGNGLEPGDNPLAAIEGPIFYDELIAALGKGAGVEVGTSLAGTPDDSTLAEGETPQGDLQGLPAEVTSQLVDQANFSPVSFQQATSLTALASSTVDASSTSGVKPVVIAAAVEAQGSPHTIIARAIAGAAAPLSAEGGATLQDQTSIAGKAFSSQSEVLASQSNILTDRNLPLDTNAAMVAPVKVVTDGLPTGPAVAAATLAAGPIQSGQSQALNVQEVIPNQTSQDADASAITNQQALSMVRTDRLGQDLSSTSDISVPTKIGQTLLVESGDAESPITRLPNVTTGMKGSTLAEGDLIVSSSPAPINISGVIEAPLIESNIGLHVLGAPQSFERGDSAPVVLGKNWQGLIPSSSGSNRAVMTSAGVGESAHLYSSADLAMAAAEVKTPVATEGFGDWRFSVRPNSANPIDTVALPADVAVQLDQGEAQIAKPISDLVPDDIRVMTIESDVRRDTSIRSPARDTLTDPAAANPTGKLSDQAVDAIASQSASAESRASLDSAKSDVASTPATREAASGLSNSIAEKFVSTLLGISGLPLESAADRAAIEFRHVRTIVAAPHMARWDAAAVQVELVRLVRDGGGQIVMKLTPPDEGSFKIDLSLDSDRGIRIFVEGASDSVKTRLEQGAEQLREQFSQMGFNLQLDMHSRREASGQPSGFGFSESGSSSESGDGRSVSAEQGAQEELSPGARRKSAVDESRVYFRA